MTNPIPNRAGTRRGFTFPISKGDWSGSHTVYANNLPEATGTAMNDTSQGGYKIEGPGQDWNLAK